MAFAEISHLCVRPFWLAEQLCRLCGAMTPVVLTQWRIHLQNSQEREEHLFQLRSVGIRCKVPCGWKKKSIKSPSGHGDGLRSHYSSSGLHMNYIYMYSRNLFDTNPAQLTGGLSGGLWDSEIQEKSTFSCDLNMPWIILNIRVQGWSDSVTLAADKLNNWDEQPRLACDTKNPSNPAVKR